MALIMRIVGNYVTADMRPSEADPYRRVAHLLARASASTGGDSENADSALEALGAAEAIAGQARITAGQE
ncbi:MULTISPECIES: hypothetical protein [Streptomyces]|uniref:Uncharacterized protein n=1 Tax=Streptomyces flaveolus TaxID=67297 RepID=A0ABV3APP5_9ACTN|nr:MULTISPECIES: hypothetical protein [Streptomyces]